MHRPVGIEDKQLLVVKLVLAAAAVLGSSVVLWVHQSGDALLRVQSFWGAIGVVLSAAAPGLLLYVILARGRVVAVVEGVAIGGMMGAQWWSSATDRHSTASIGPFVIGWLVIPAVVFVTLVAQNWNTDLVSTPAKIALLLPATLLLLLAGPVGWLIAAVLWWLTRRRRRREVAGTAS